MIFRVQQNLAKWSSRILKRLFDIIGSIFYIIILSPALFYISRKVKKDGDLQSMGMRGLAKEGVHLNV